MNAEPTFDKDGYPTDETLAVISNWDDYKDIQGWLDYVKEAWDHHYGRIWEEGEFLKFATGGWSANEMVIRAMKESRPPWNMLWESSHRGGLHVLRKPKVTKAD